MDLTFPTIREIPVSSTMRARIRLFYLWRHGRLPDLDNPQSFNEWVQWRKLHDRDIKMPMLADKVRVKHIVADHLGPEWVTPTYWHGLDLPKRPDWQVPIVVKSRHGCGHLAIVLDGYAKWDAIRRKASRWVTQDYGRWLDEWLYDHIPRGILVEPYLGNGPSLPIDYKFFVFGGRVEFVQVHLDRAGQHRWIVFDRKWQRVSSPTRDMDPPPPRNLARMIEAAEELGRQFDFVRVDLYEVDAKPLFGEMTFYPGSGLDRFSPVSLDHILGAHWSAAKEANSA